MDLTHHAERLLAAHSLAGADPAPIAGLLARCSQRRVAIGQPLLREGDVADEVGFLLEGRVSVLKKDPTGNDRQVGSWFAPALLGGMSSVGGEPCSVSCVAGAPCVVAVLPAAEAMKIVGDTSPTGAQLRFMLLSASTEVLANVTEHLRGLLSTPPHAPATDLDRLLALLHGAKDQS